MSTGAVPIYDTGTQDGVVIGVLTGSNRTEDLLSLLDTRLMNDSAVHVYVMNSEGRFVVYDQTESDAQRACSLWSGKADQRVPSASGRCAQRRTSRFFHSGLQRGYQISTLPLNIHDWHVLCAVPQAELVSDISHWFSFQRITFPGHFRCAALCSPSISIALCGRTTGPCTGLPIFDSVTGAYNRVAFSRASAASDRPAAGFGRAGGQQHRFLEKPLRTGTVQRSSVPHQRCV